MADNNQNRSSYASDENWDKNQGRYVDDNNYNQQSSYNPNNLDLDRDGNVGSTGGYFGGTNYMGSSNMGGNFMQNDEHRKNQNWQNDKGRNYEDWNDRQRQGGNYSQQSRQNYNRNYGQGQYGNMSNQQYSSQHNRNEDFRGQDYNQYNQQSNQGNRNQWPEDYRYGNTSHYGGGSQGQGEYPKNYGHTSGVGHIDDQGGHGDWGREARNRGAWNDNSNWNRQHRNTNYRGDNRDRRDERSWWDKTRDEVASWFGGDDDDRRNRSEERRTGEHRGKGPKQYSRSDTRIHEDVCDRLAEDSFVDASDIEVKVENGEVTLNGTVDTRASRRRVEDLVDSISGVKHVQNNIRIGQAMTVGSSTIKSSAVQNTSGKTGDTSSTSK